jgi:hypothetical protein
VKSLSFGFLSNLPPLSFIPYALSLMPYPLSFRL